MVGALRAASPPAALDEVAARVVTDYLGVQPHESFLLVTDTEVPAELAEAIFAAARKIGSDPTHIRIAPRATSGAEPPAAVIAAMVQADVCLCIASRSLYHTNATGRAKAAGTRGCFNAPSNLSAWTEGAMTADHRQIRAVAERLAARLRGAHWVRATSPAGTDITVSIEGREPKGWYTGIVRNPGEITAYPGGEVSFPPLEGTSNGVIVVERVMTDLGGLAEPITIVVRDGMAVEITGGHDARRLLELIRGIPNATNLAELGIGLNPAARISDAITESKKALGTAHLALGDNAGGYGGVVECAVHLDGLVLDVTIEVDGEVVMQAGTVLV
jgi:leucyl aminopeptidase (aminopeptidase T)